MATFTIGRAEGTAVGRDVEASIGSTIGRAEGSAIGFSMLAFGAAPAASTVPDALRLEIVTVDGTQLVNDFTARRNLTFTVEHNGSGIITFDTDLDAFADGIEDALLDPSNLVRVHFGDLPDWPYGVAEGFITSAPPVKDATGRWTLTVSCPGSWDVLDFGVLWPPAGATGGTREFSYTAGETGPSWVPTQWGTPIGKNVKESFRWKQHHWPAGWPESKADWIGVVSPDKWEPVLVGGSAFFGADGATAKIEQFVGAFTTTETNAFRFYFAGDDTISLYLNSVKVKHKGRDAWHTTSSFTRTLPPGTHIVAASVGNVAGEDGKSGFLIAIARLKDDGSHGAWVLRSSPSTFKVKKVPGYFAQVPLPPDGWYPAAVLYTHLSEAAVRGVEFHPQIVPTFTTTTDSSGAKWTAKGPAEYDIAISGAELGEKIRAGGVDAAMLPGLRLASWADRGFDLRDRVVISKPLNTGWSSRAWPRVRTVGLTHHESGWTATAGDGEVTAEFGRRELALSGGGVDGSTQADVFAKSAMTTAGSPEETIEVEITAADMVDPDHPTPMPFRDFNVADTITVETIGGFQPIKVMSITGAEQDTKEARFTIAGYPV